MHEIISFSSALVLMGFGPYFSGGLRLLESDLGEKQGQCAAIYGHSCLLFELTRARNQGWIQRFSGGFWLVFGSVAGC